MAPTKTVALYIAASLMVSAAGCKKTADNTANYESALNTYYSANTSCLWQQSQKFPTQIAASDDAKTAPFAALVDQGLLARTISEKKIVIISKQEVNYDLTDKGRSAWTADASQPGYGNFCYGHRTATTIYSATPNSGEPGATTVVNFHYGFSSAPDWARAAETQNAFPQLQADLAGGTATATLLDANNGWQVQTPLPASKNVTPADGKIVE
jgi:hypothetical protein